jgi:cytochrome oxidase Cu insertion factor (SCO1/SenC/PrrC family)
MHGMFRPILVLALASSLVHTANAGDGDPANLTEESFRANMGFAPTLRISYRNRACQPVGFEEFARQMSLEGTRTDTDRSADGSAITLTIRGRGASACPAPYPPITHMPAFDLRDLEGKRITAATLKGKPTLVNFYFATCIPCILEVGPLNEFAAARPHMNFVAITFDEPDEARAFVKRYGFKWRVVPNARDFIDQVRVKSYPMMALFDENGRLLGTKRGGARDELEAANVGPQLARWTDGLLRNAKE